MRWRNYGLWVSVSSVVYMVFRDMGLQIDLTQWETYVTAILGILATLGVISNPEQGRGYFAIKRQGNNPNAQNMLGQNQGMQQTNSVQRNQEVRQNQLPVQNQYIQGSQEMEPEQQNQRSQQMELVEPVESTQQNAESEVIDQVQRDFIGAEHNERY